jgi:hypothetical protein
MPSFDCLPQAVSHNPNALPGPMKFQHSSPHAKISHPIGDGCKLIIRFGEQPVNMEYQGLNKKYVISKQKIGK